jgi:hypothetical protein
LRVEEQPAEERFRFRGRLVLPRRAAGRLQRLRPVLQGLAVLPAQRVPRARPVRQQGPMRPASQHSAGAQAQSRRPHGLLEQRRRARARAGPARLYPRRSPESARRRPPAARLLIRSTRRRVERPVEVMWPRLRLRGPRERPQPVPWPTEFARRAPPDLAARRVLALRSRDYSLCFHAGIKHLRRDAAGSDSARR